MGFDEFLQVFDGLSTGCGEAASSKTWFCWLKPVFFAETSSKPGVGTSSPGKPSFWTVFDYGILRVFMGFDEFLQVFDGLSTGCGEAASSKTWFCWLKPVFSQKLAENQVLIPRPTFFRDLVDVGYMMMISNFGKYLFQPSLGTKISFIYIKSR